MGGQLGNLVGPAFGGILIAGPGLRRLLRDRRGGFAVFALSMLLVRPLPPTVRAERPGLRSLADGFRFVRRSGVVGGMLLIDTNAMIFGMPTALFPALAAEHFHGGSATFGLLDGRAGPGRDHRRRDQRLDRPSAAAGHGRHRRRASSGAARSSASGWSAACRWRWPSWPWPGWAT